MQMKSKHHLSGSDAFAAFCILSMFLTVTVHLHSADESTSDETDNIIPHVDKIESMVAELYCNPYEILGSSDIEKFQLPRREYQSVLNLFREFVKENDKDLTGENEIGTIRITLKDGRCVRICWFDRGKNRMRFSVGGRSYIRTGEWFGSKAGRYTDETLAVDRYIRAIYERMQESGAKPDAPIGFNGNEAGERRDLVEDIFFRWCPAGKFIMGVDDSATYVELTEGFWLGETEVTQGQWRSLMETTPWKGRKFIVEGEDYPATYISHDQAVQFANKLTVQQRAAGRLPEDWKYSLPLEAQWEYACRAGTITEFSFGDGASNSSKFGWFQENASKKNEEYAHRVGFKKPNAWELKDMHGNVREWCNDWYKDKFQGGQDPVGPSTGSYRVFRGGSWIFPAGSCYSALRECCKPDLQSEDLGFRIAAVPE